MRGRWLAPYLNRSAGNWTPVAFPAVCIAWSASTNWCLRDARIHKRTPPHRQQQCITYYSCNAATAPSRSLTPCAPPPACALRCSRPARATADRTSQQSEHRAAEALQRRTLSTSSSSSTRRSASLTASTCRSIARCCRTFCGLGKSIFWRSCGNWQEAMQPSQREAIRLYRDIVRTCRRFTWVNEKGEPWCATSQNLRVLCLCCVCSSIDGGLQAVCAASECEEGVRGSQIRAGTLCVVLVVACAVWMVWGEMTDRGVDGRTLC